MARGDFKRWLYRGHRPNWMARVENRMYAVLFSWGILPNSMVTLEVSGRTSGRTISLPMAVTVVNGQRYLVSMLGEHVQWVHNVRTARGRAVIHWRGREEPTGCATRFFDNVLLISQIAFRKDADMVPGEDCIAIEQGENYDASFLQ